MKIGILTFHYPNNYGALLQSYSLVVYLRMLGHEADIVDYVPSLFRESNFFSGSKTFRGFVGNLLRIPFYKKWLNRCSKLNSFRNILIRNSSKIDETNYNFSQYDIVITGSDQTFNKKFSFTDIYFQNYEKLAGHRKIAYAPSFGSMDLSINIDSSTLNLLNDFDSLSCREIEGAAYLSRLLKKDVPNVLDPVFLTNKEDWSKLAENDIPYKNYVFIYDLNGKMPMINLAKQLYPNKRLVIFSNDVLMPFYARKLKNVSFVQDIGVEEFLGYIKQSDEIITDSFHGTAFSIIFEKQFHAYIALEKTAGRIYSLLSELNISGQIINRNEQPRNSVIKYEDVTLNLSKKIQKSYDYIDSCLQ